MSAENLKGCCPHTRRLPLPSKGVVDHSTKIPGGGSRDPIPLEHISAGTTHLNQGAKGQGSLSPDGGLITATTSSPNALKSPKLQYNPGVKGHAPLSPKVYPRLRTYQDIANFFGVSRMTLFRWLKLRPFPHAWINRYYCRDNHHLRVDSSRMIKWLDGLISEFHTNKARYLWRKIIRNVT